MSEDTLIVAIVFGSIVGIVVISQIFSLIKTSIKNKNNAYDEDAFERMAHAFLQYKKETTRRLENLEAIVTDEESASLQKPLKSPSSKQIEIDSDSVAQKKSTESDQNLRNMLRE